MGFRKFASLEVLGHQHKNTWHRSAATRTASVFMDGVGNIDMERVLDVVASEYFISRDPDDYLLVPARANSADRMNANKDGFSTEELLRFDPLVAKRVYQTYDLRPHFVNHQSDNLKVARGVVLDSFYNTLNLADDNVKRAVYEDSGKEASTDDFVEILIAVDMTKDPRLADAYKSGSVYKFSMGCDIEESECSICKNRAVNTFQFCDHIKGKYSGRLYTLDDGRSVQAGEWCLGTRFAEISAVDDPADKDALVQEGLLQRAASSLSSLEVREIISFAARHAGDLPDSLAELINHHLNSGE